METQRDLIGRREGTIRVILIILIILVAITLRVYRINTPWNGDHDSAGATLGNAAYYFSTYGLCETGPLLIKNEVKVGDTISFDYYINHPPFEVLIISLSYALFGKSEATTRLVAIVFSILSVVLVFLLCYRLFGNRAALLAALFMAVNPIDAYYGRLPHFFEAAKALLLLTLFLYFLWEERGGLTWAFLVVISLLLGLATDWPVYFLPPALFLYELLKRGKRNLLFGAFLNVFSVLAFIMFLLAVAGTIGRESFFQLFSFYRHSEGSSGASVWEFISSNAYKIVVHFGIGWILLIGLWLLANLTNAAQGAQSITDRTYRKRGLILILLFVGVMNILLFPSHSINHRYWIDFLSPFFAVVGGYCADALFSLGQKKRWLTAAVTFLVILFVMQSVFIYVRRSSRHDYFPLTIEMTDAVNKSIENRGNILFITPILVSDDIYHFYTGCRIVRVKSVSDLNALAAASPYRDLRFVTIDRDTAQSMSPFVRGLSTADLKSWGFYPEGDDPFIKSGIIGDGKKAGRFTIYSINTEMLKDPQ
jgi:4-amino-4-deoxy-L-arabinose transferase-like glycosyltransferase